VNKKFAAAISRTPSVEKVLDTRREVVSMWRKRFFEQPDDAFGLSVPFAIMWRGLEVL
jgi:hypothetical protein